MPSLSTVNNLKLAWIRTLSGENVSYRNLQRIEIDAFGWAEEDNLQQLRKELLDGSYAPKPATKIYIPKASGLLRPLTLLDIRDTIIYQAIANLLADKAKTHLAPYSLKSTFSNILTSSNYPYFFRRWKYGFNKLNSTKRAAFASGHTWLGELDLTSFYDVIDHDLLKEILLKLYGEDDLLEKLLSCLSEWSIHHDGLGLKHSHGVPQGPLPSSFIAECVLHTLDKRIGHLQNSVYLRYVDNITIMSTNEKEARKLFGRIEILCRELGLIPQIKRPIQELQDINSLIFDEPSMMQNVIDYPISLNKKQNDKVRKIFLSCFKNGKIDKNEEQVITKLNYSLYRMNPDKRILNKTLDLLNSTPCVSNSVNYYLRKFGKVQYICDYLLAYLESDPAYASVIAECMETIYLNCIDGSYGRLRRICIKFLSKNYHIMARSAAVKILGLRKIHVKQMQRILNNTKDVYLTEHLLVALCNAISTREQEILLNIYIREENSSTALISAFLLTMSSLKLIGNKDEVNAWATPILKNAGLTNKRVIGDRVGELLKKRYGINIIAGFSFRTKLNRSQYRQALIHLNMAEGGFATNRSLWATQMDCFNQILLWIVYPKIGIPIQIGNEFGSINAVNLRSNFPNIAAVFSNCHNLRLSNPVPHAFSRLLGTYSQTLKSERERNCAKN